MEETANSGGVSAANKQLKEVVTNIRAALISTKEKCDLRSLSRDYRMMVGEDIPYRKFKFSNLEDFLKSVPSLHLSKYNGITIVTAIPNENVQHIVDMVGRQRSVKRRPQRSVLSRYSSSRQMSRGRRTTNWFKPVSTNTHHKISNTSTSSFHPPLNPPPLTNYRKRSPDRRSAEASATTPNTSMPRYGHSVSVDHEQEKRTTLIRSKSSPLNGVSGVDPPNIIDSSAMGRPRMRSQASVKSPTSSFSSPTGIRCGTPLQTDTINKILAWRSRPANVYRSNDNVSTPSGSIPKLTRNADTMKSETSRNVYNPVQSLMDFTKQHNLPEPVFKLIPDEGKTKKFDYSIKIGELYYSNYPTTCMTPAAAKDIAAENALIHLSRKHKVRTNLLISTEVDLLERIPPMIQSYYHGLWASEVALQYQEKFNEQVPPNWLQLLDTLPRFNVEPTFNDHVIKYSSDDANAVMVPANIPSNRLIYNETGWPVEVTCAISTVEIWCRCLDPEEANKYEKLMTEMKAYYSQNGPAMNIVVGLFYVVMYQDIWCRVRVLEIKDEGVTCFFVDYGDEELIPRNHVYRLEPKFAECQAQAFLCQLAGLEELVNLSSVTKYLEKLVGKHCLAVPSKHPKSLNVESGCASSISVILKEEEDNLNKEIMQLAINESVIQSITEGGIISAYVRHADNKGNIYVQAQSEGADLFDTKIMHLNNDTSTPDLFKNAVLIDNPEQIYLTKWSKDEMYYRCKIVDRSPDQKFVQIYFIDFGNYDVEENHNQFVPIQKVSRLLSSFPPQVIQICTDIPREKLPANFADRIIMSVPVNELVLLKLLKFRGDEIPICDIFLRSKQNDRLFSVVATLQYDTETSNKSVDDGNNNYVDKAKMLSDKLERLRTMSEREDKLHQPVPSAGVLNTPELPSVNAYFDVRVPDAVNPWNFFIQPYNTYPQLREMMDLLQIRYVDNRGKLELNDITPGMIYASQYSDGLWYRTSVIKIIHSGSISVFYCDYGYYANLRIDQLFTLDEEFFVLPHQAIKAKLTGIQPRNTKWTMEDCEAFKNLVCGQTFVSILTSVEKDELYKSDVVLNLKLVKTDGPNDILFDKLLIDMSIAIPDVTNS